MSNYVLHRRVSNPSAEGADLSTLLASMGHDDRGVPVFLRGAAQTNGWNGLNGFIELAGGVSPTVILMPLIVISKPDRSHTLARLPNMGPFTDGSHFSLPDTRGSRIYLRVHAVTGSPTSLSIYLFGWR